MGISVRVALVASIASLFGSSLSAHAHSSYPCWGADEIEAARIKDFQTWMTVGVLKCGDFYHNMAGNYNYFIVENRKTLARYQDLLKARFVRWHGQTKGRQAYDKFTTALANRHSRDADASSSSFCAAVDQATRAAVAIAADAGSPDELEALAAVRPERAWYASADCAAPVAELAPALPQSMASTSQSLAAERDPAPQPVGATGAAVAIAPQPVQYSHQSNSVAAGPGASPSIAAALQAAATALQTAAAALQQAQQGPDQAHSSPP